MISFENLTVTSPVGDTSFMVALKLLATMSEVVFSGFVVFTTMAGVTTVSVVFLGLTSKSNVYVASLGLY